MKEKMVKRYVALRKDYTEKKLYLSGADMYPKFYQTEEEAQRFNKSYIFAVEIPERFVENNDL